MPFRNNEFEWLPDSELVRLELNEGIRDQKIADGVIDFAKVIEKAENPEYMREDHPSLFMSCGTEDSLLQENRNFHEFLENENVDVAYQESTGIHDWKFWDEYLEPAIKWMLK